ncbi:MAG: ATP-binding cassette domain-containing protein [Bacilli bacterium]|nr:ATP-binding cassette domain-containing protein [Bacilli bacterium]
MLEVKKVTKIYSNEEVELKALDKVSINFRKNEFVSILGASGSGKSTLLNMIGGLDHYDSGDLLINGVSTKEYKDSDWDMYRNHKIGFIFQNYNLITHQTILTNVELALTVSGISKNERIKRAKEALKKVGLEKQINKRPGQLSGGQMQRVAIARALVNDPEIVLADEPTGALDSKTSVQIMDLLKEVAKDKLVIMVTHNKELADKYSTRIVELKDGKVINDTKEFDGKEKVKDEDNKKKSSMSLLTALSLSKNNLFTKKGRTIMTAIAGSIGIIGIALVLALSNGVNNYIDNMQKSSFGSQAISMKNTTEETKTSSDYKVNKKKKKSHKNAVLANDDISNNIMLNATTKTRKNNLKKMKEYLDNNKEEINKYASNIIYSYNVDLQLYDKDSNGEVVKINPNENATDVGATGLESMFSTSLVKNAFIELKDNNQYKVLSGHMPKNKNEVVLVVNKKGEIDLSTIYSLNIENKDTLYSVMEKQGSGEKINLESKVLSYNSLIGKTYKLINGVDYYEKVGNAWISREDDNNYVNSLYEDGQDIKIVGVVKVKDNNSTNGFLGYTHELIEDYTSIANNSDIVKEQKRNPKVNVFTGLAFDNINDKYENNLKKLASADMDDPYEISIYPKKFESKEKIKKFIDNYNKKVDKKDKIKYTDDIETLTGALTSIVKMISMVIIAFVSISLIVSSIMIGIITYISVLERTKEIGILRAIGASKKDIRRVFRAETIIEGLLAGGLGVIISFLLSLSVNGIVKVTAKIDNVMSFSIVHALILILLSVGLTVFAGLRPANMASKKDPVESLKTE